MNDADLGDTIEERIGQLEESKVRSDKRFANDDAHLYPSRWWFASSAFPMIAGTLGPVASAFSICALVRPWRQHYPPGTDITSAAFVKDPKWLIIVNAIQLIIALISNVFLLLNMARRVRFSLAQPITIAGWYASAVCLIALNATAAGPLVLKSADEYILSQAFYYGMFAAILYFVTASLMIVTVYGANTRHYSKDFQLSLAQRTLMLQTILFLLYLLIGALVFSTIEGWAYLDAVYWADVTLFTVGFGDFAAATHLGRALLIPYALVGVISLGLVIGSIRSLVLERGRRRLDARMVEKKRRQLIRKMTRKGKDEVLKPIHQDSGLSSARSAELERREREFSLMRKIQYEASVRRRWMAMSISLSSVLILWLVGAKIFQECERPYQHWSYFDGFYFAFVTLTTIGYGDRTPISNAGKAFFVFWSLLALPTMTVMISNAGDTVVKAVRDTTLELGNITILPGELGFRRDLKSFLHHLSCGTLFRPSEKDEETQTEDEDEDEDNGLPAGFFSNSHRRRQTSFETDGETDRTEAYSLRRPQPPSAPGLKRSHSTQQSSPDLEHREKQPDQREPATPGRSRRRSSPHIRSPTTPLPASRADYHFLLISEIAVVQQHIKEKPARRYTFAEWAWYLKLIGEDESNPATHRKARPHRHGKKRGKKSGDADDDREGKWCLEDKWSWVGPQSPLMGSQEESEWILSKLIAKLRDELDVVRREELEGKSAADRERDLADEEKGRDEVRETARE
ncbi:ion channel protein [Colletotrichum graminicola]|uniref:Ion channel protein n=1 Tax=Colletotrichum graminicola (strain M1.001 / M2 / FGSC 10212) TaxID=645133 RepID=E3QU89_COLGM|nr:ion channel protein [Colletotrichum graminicola M1.001]EFQ34427.1 ion channel protein [Colletotrichum graminicola M1.001]WDK08872.1 ion channel protein [Colletotrichum graminicola]